MLSHSFLAAHLHRLVFRHKVTIEAVIKRLNISVSKRLKMTLKKYRRLINKELWLDAGLAAKIKAVDGQALQVTCDAKLITTKILVKKKQCSLFGGCTTIFYLRPKCPLLYRQIEPVKKPR